MKGDAIKYAIRFFVGKKILSGVPAIIMNQKGEILLEKRSKKMWYYPDMWGLPGGLIEYGETIEQAIKRELREELGVDSQIIKYGRPVMQLPEKKQNQYINTPVFCKIIGTPKPLDETSEIRWFKPSEIKNMKLAYNHIEILKNEGII